jgi:hypothetical protein
MRPVRIAPDAMAPFCAINMDTMSSIKPMFVGFLTFSGIILAMAT